MRTIVANHKGWVECPYCRKKIQASVFSSDSCEHCKQKILDNGIRKVIFEKEKE